jgi:hypothetical protein
MMSNLMSKRQELEARRDQLREALQEARRKLLPLESELDRVQEQLERLDFEELPPVKVGDRVFINGNDTTATWYTWATVRAVGQKWIHVHVDGDSGVYSAYEKTRKVLRREILLVNPTNPVWLHDEGHHPPETVRDYYVADGFVACVRGPSYLREHESGHEAFLEVGRGRAWENLGHGPFPSGTREQMKLCAEVAYLEWMIRQKEP